MFARIRGRRLAALALVLALPLLGLSAAAGRPAASTLVADAGDSAFVVAGEAVDLGGMAWGGRAPYRYSWSYRGAADRFTHPGEASTSFKTDGLAVGDHMVSLAVTDASGATSRDTVKLRIYRFESRAILSETGTVDFGVPDELLFDPSEDSPDGQTTEYPFKLPAGIRALELELEWTTYAGDPGVYGVNDLDLHVDGPDPAYIQNSGGASAGMPERLRIERPKPGSYRAIVASFVSAPDDFELKVSVVPDPVSPVPEIDAPASLRLPVTGGQRLTARAPAGSSLAWDLDFDGVYERSGGSVSAGYRKGTHLATVKAVRDGFEMRKTIAVHVIDPGEEAANTSPFVIIGVGDSGINAYHDEFSAVSYPDPEVLRITENFTRHPSEYIAGYPKDVPAIRITLGKGYLPKEDEKLWTRDAIVFQKQYWIPGTKIVGAIDWTDSSGSNAASDSRPILDDDGHGTGSSSVSAGNRFGNCPACLLAFAEGLQGDEWLVTQSWIDIVSMSVGTQGNVGFGIADSEHTRIAAERGQSVLFAAGNGFGNAFDVPMSTYTSGSAGPDWHVVVGAARTDNRRPVIGDANPVDISSWGDGTIPSACISGTVSMCNFGGTSAATPLTAGVFGQVLREIRRAIGDTDAGQRPGQVVASGRPVPASTVLRDGRLTRAELWDVVLHTAEPFGTGGAPVPPYVHTWPGPESEDYLFGGYGLATPQSAEHAIAVALGRAPKPSRETEDAFFELDREVRQTLWGPWSEGSGAQGTGGADYPARALEDLTFTDVMTFAEALDVMAHVARASTPAPPAASGVAAQAGPTQPTYFLHHAGGCAAIDPPAGPDLEPHDGYTYMDGVDREGDDEPCPNSRATTVAAYYRPVGIWGAPGPVGVDLPAGTKVDATIYVTMDHPMLLEATGFLLAGKRIVGRGVSAPVTVVDVAAAKCAVDVESCWTEVPVSFKTDRPVGSWEILTFQVALRSSENTFFGYEGDHASRVVLTPATGSGAAGLAATITSLADGARVAPSALTVSGTARFSDVESESFRGVEMSIDDPTFSAPIAATSAKDYTSWTVSIPIPAGQHTLYVRARQDRRSSEVDAVAVFAGVSVQGTLPTTGVGSTAGLGLLLSAGAAALAVRRRRFAVR